jgi:Papain family cysteine protease
MPASKDATIALFALAIGCQGTPFATPPVDAGPAELATVDKTPPRAPPTLRAPHPVVPPLPDLPELSAHDAPATAPPSPASSDHPCGTVWSGSGIVPLVCTSSSLLFGVGEGGATVIVPDAKMHGTAPALPAVVDHRLEGSEGPVRDQRNTPACTAFAIATAIDHALLRWMPKSTAVSSMHVWSRYRTPEERSSIDKNLGLSLGGEGDWPWNPTEANGWVSCPLSGKPPASGCGLPVNEAHLQKVQGKPVAILTHVQYLADVTTQTLESKLAAGQDVILTMLLPDAFLPKGKAGARYIPHYAKAAPDAGHALIVAGYARLPHGTYFLLHNSWGTLWGDSGYAWLHEATVKAWAKEAVVLDAQPKVDGDGGRPKRVRGELTCESGFLPDSIRGVCAARCADGSPRHDGVCPVAGQCPTGMVNLTGACVLAAPSGSGHDPDTGVDWTCGAGGCTYTVPRAVDKPCTGNACLVSCPAPDFHLARVNDQMTCIE